MTTIIILFLIYALVQLYACCVASGRAERLSEKYRVNKNGTEEKYL